MPDNPVLRVEADSEQVQKLIAAVTSHNSTIRQASEAYKQLNAITRDNATAQQLLTGEWSAAGAAQTVYRTRIRETNMEMSGQSNVIKQARQEHRLYMFAIMEGLHAFDGLIGKNKELATALQSAAGAALGMKFALDAMGVAGSGPLAIVAGGIALVTTILNANKQAAEEDAKAWDDLIKKHKELVIETGGLDLTGQLAQATGELVSAEGAEAAAKKGKSVYHPETRGRVGGEIEIRAAYTETIYDQKEILRLDNERLAALAKVQGLEKQIETSTGKQAGRPA